jgi:RNA polymerase sigma factor (TIGR02999 family)
VLRLPSRSRQWSVPREDVLPATNEHITQLLVEWSEGKTAALDQLAPLVYEELQRMAGRHLRREAGARTLQTTGLVHEAFLRLVDQKNVRWQSRAHFFSLASKFMRRILVDQARARFTAKRGEGRANINLDDLGATLEGGGENLLAEQQHADEEKARVELMSIDTALARLEALDQRQAQIVELRFFGGLTVEETAQTLEISDATVKRDWIMAKSWLARELACDAD